MYKPCYHSIVECEVTDWCKATAVADIKADIELLKADVLCFCETWLSPAQSSPVIKADHVTLRCDRQNDHKGGAMLSLPSGMQPCRTATFASNGIESVVTNVQFQGQQLQVAAVYRSPSVSIQQLVQHMTMLLEYVNNVNIATIIVGDFNDDVMCERGSQVDTQLVMQPTTDRATLIDHVYFSGQCNGMVVQVLDVYYSDHDAVYCSVPVWLM